MNFYATSRGHHRTPRGRKPLSAEERKAHRLAATRKAARKWWRHHAEEQNRKRRNRRKLQDKKLLGKTPDGLHLTTRQGLESPRLYYMDQHGQIHHEEQLSAEELIDLFKLAFIRKNKGDTQ